MGLFTGVSEKLNKQFSIFQLMEALEMDESDFSEARNILVQWSQIGIITRLSKNMYEKTK